jgi:hypothetical protein
MSYPNRTLAMNSKKEDFPTPVSPTRRRVNITFVSFFDVLMIPSLSASMLLEKTVRTIHQGIVETCLVGMVSP